MNYTLWQRLQIKWETLKARVRYPRRRIILLSDILHYHPGQEWESWIFDTDTIFYGPLVFPADVEIIGLNLTIIGLSCKSIHLGQSRNCHLILCRAVKQ